MATIDAVITAFAKTFPEQGIKDGIQVNSVVPGICPRLRPNWDFPGYPACDDSFQKINHRASHGARPHATGTASRSRGRASHSRPIPFRGTENAPNARE
jgi:hypothetical protein